MNRILRFLLPVLTVSAAAMLFGACAQTKTGAEAETAGQHSWGEWVVEEATCEKDGHRSRICTDPWCGASQTEKIEKLGHDYAENVVVPPTCTEKGESEFVCTRDPAHRFRETIPALGHDWKEMSDYIAPTCTEKGHSVAAVCLRCDLARGETDLAPLGHDFSGEVTVKEATCEEDGERTVACVRGCGSCKTETIPALGHDYSGEVTVKEATCEEDGERTVACVRGCGSCKTETIPAFGHDWNYAGETHPATCTEPGYSTAAVCSRCGFKQGKTEIPALGHDYNIFYDQKEMPTCMKDGKAAGKCKRCGISDTLILPKVDHDYSLVFTLKKPTCLGEGEIQYGCIFGCGAVKEPEVAPALGHDWEETRIIREPSCTECGTEEHICRRCGTKENHTVEALGHKFVDRVTKAATDSSAGQKQQFCLFCQAAGDADTIPIPSNNVLYEIQLVRLSGLEYIAANEVTYKVYSDDNRELRSFGAGAATTAVRLPREAKKLVVTGLRDGFGTDSRSYTLDPYNPVVIITLSAGVRNSTRVESDGKKEEKKPDKPIDEGDPMSDFVVRDTKHGDHSQDQWFSEVIKGKKLVMFDFFWTGCTSCAGLMSQFLEIYGKILQPYKDDILVIMVDVMADESDAKINSFVESKQYPKEFLTCHGREEDSGFDLLHWFELDSHRAGIPMCIFTDGEGVVTKIGGFAVREDFEAYYLGYFGTYRAPAEKTAESEAAPAAAQEAARMPVLFCGGKRRFKF